MYDHAGNLTSETDALSSITTIGYDDLNRVSSKTYTAGSGAQANTSVQYCYDGVTTPTACSSAPAGSNLKGRLTMVSNGNSVTRYKTFHPLGWITSSTQRTSAADFDFSYTYDLAGGLASVSYPSGKTVNYCADSAGRMTKATRDNSVIAQANLFWPSGLIGSLQYANGVTETVEINQQRQQITSITAAKGATQLLKLDYGYGTAATSNNGNVMKQTITRGSDVAVEDYGYDELNRLQTAARTGATALSPYTERYCYDRYGNRAVTSGSTAVPGTTGMTPVVADVDCAVASSINNATVAGLFPGNRWTAGAPDTVGNVVNDGRNTLQYDVEGRLYRSSRTIGSTAYEEISYYDGDGRRVRRETKSGPVTVPPTTPTTQTNTVYVYDALGALAAEYGTGGPQVTGLRYLTADHLGSTRLVTDAAGAEVDRHDFRPFGQEWPERPIVLNTLFTGKDRDERRASITLGSGIRRAPTGDSQARIQMAQGPRCLTRKAGMPTRMSTTDL